MSRSEPAIREMLDIESAPPRREVEDTSSVKATVDRDEFNRPRNSCKETGDKEQTDRPASHLRVTATSVA